MRSVRREREAILKNALAVIQENYDFIFFDCPPALGLITLNALTASDSFIVPIQCEYYALEGLSQLMATVRTIKRLYNPYIELEGVLLTMYDGRLNLTQQVVAEVKNFFPKMQNLSGKNLYASPHTMPATIAAMMSMKLNLEICTRLYTKVVTTNPTVGVHRAEKRFWMHPLQKISSAGPIMNSINRLSTNGFSPSFIPYMESTCGRAKSKSKILTDLFHDMGIKVIAEGAETEEQVEALRSYRVDSIQGYYFAKPMPLEVLKTFFNDQNKLSFGT